MNKEELGDLYDEAFRTKVIETEDYKLFIQYSNSCTMFNYQPKGYWTDVIKGRIETTGYGRGDHPEEGVSLDISHSSGGNGKDWLGREWNVDCELSFIKAYQDCYARVKDYKDEVVRIHERKDIDSQWNTLMRAEREAKFEAAKLVNPILDDKELRRVIKEAANLGKYATLKWTILSYDCSLDERKCPIKPKGIYWYKSPETQKAMLKMMTGKATAIEISYE